MFHDSTASGGRQMITVAYLLLLILGVAWVVHRIKSHMRSEREREDQLGALFSEPQFKAYLEELRKQKLPNPGVEMEPKSDANPGKG